MVPDSTDTEITERRRPERATDALGKRLRHAEMLLDVHARLAAMETLDDALEELVTITSRETGADRVTLFLNDEETGELYSRVALGKIRREIRVLNTTGIAGHVFSGGESMIIHDAYSEPHFNRAVDEQTGYETRNIMCTPIRTVKGETIGVAQCLNKKRGRFSEENLTVLKALTLQASMTLNSAQFAERMQKSRELEREFLEVLSRS